jgi:N-acetyl-anhydromuramyl-L-alanine amidase AmpD
MKRIITHWTAGVYNPNQTDLEHYHYLITAEGLVIKGKYEPKDNENCQDGKYAQHTGGGNTGSIGIAMCGMYVPKNTPLQMTKYPLTKIQCEKCFSLIAEIAKEYKFQITPNTVMTHYEFGLKHPYTSSAGKIDITWLPPYPYLKANEIGDFIRNKAKWYYLK